MGKPTYRASIEGGSGLTPNTTTAAGSLINPINNSHGRSARGRDRSGEAEVQERYKRFREKGDFVAEVDDDPVGRPWGRFDSSGLGTGREGDGDGDGDGKREEEGGGGGILPLRLPIKNPDPNRVVRGAGAG